MKFIDSIIKDIPMTDYEKSSDSRFSVNVRALLEGLKEYEVEIPKEFYEKYKNEYGNGVLQYVEEQTGKQKFEYRGYNTYNWNGAISHNLDGFISESSDGCYVVIRVHRTGDVRYNYTDMALLKFEFIEQWFEIADDIAREQCSGYEEVDGKHYYYDLSIFQETIHVYCEEDNKECDIIAIDEEDFKSEIREWRNKECKNS